MANTRSVIDATDMEASTTKEMAKVASGLSMMVALVGWLGFAVQEVAPIAVSRGP